MGAADGCCSPLGWSSLNINKPPVELHLLWVLMRQTNTTLLQWLQSWISTHQSAPAAACLYPAVKRTKTSGASFPNALCTLLKGMKFEFLPKCEGKEWGEVVLIPIWAWSFMRLMSNCNDNIFFTCAVKTYYWTAFRISHSGMETKVYDWLLLIYKFIAQTCCRVSKGLFMVSTIMQQTLLTKAIL